MLLDRRQVIMKILLLICGFISLGLAILGIFLPVLPTTPLLLLAAYLFSKSSQKQYDWLLQHPRFGPYIIQFREQKIIPRHIKLISMLMLWATILLSVYLLRGNVAIQVLLLIIAIGVSWHILSYRSK